MKKLFRIFIITCLLAPSMSFGAVTVHKKSAVNKKASVETQSSGGLASATSLLPTALGLVGSVMSLKKAQQELGADCVPTSSEITLVNDLVKEWARVGDTDADGAKGSVDWCGDNTSYQTKMEIDHEKLCFEKFTDEGIWKGYPKASLATIGKKTYSNVYDVFAKISFGSDDYTVSEASKVKSLLEKTDRCAPGKISAKKRELLGGFLTNTITQVGSGAGVSGVGDVMQMATQFGAGGGGASSMLNSFGSMIPGMMQQ